VELFGNEPVLRDGAWAGYVRAAAFGHTIGAAVGLAQVTCADGVTAGWLQAGGFAVRAGDGRDVTARLQLAPFYDPQRARILA
jgi:glycine cleavage system aminomethyltransferase T